MRAILIVPLYMKRIFFSLLIVGTFSYSQYSLTIDHIGGAKKAGENNTVRVVLTHNGTPIFTIDRKLPFDVPFPASYINETTGFFILSFPFDGFVEVYNAKGNKIWEQNFFKEMTPNYERTITVALGNSVIAFLTSDVTLAKAIAHRFAIDGKQQWETMLPHSIGYEIALSPDEQTIIAGSYFVLEDEVRQTASMIDVKGVIKENVDVLFQKAVFSNDNSFVALITRNEIVLVSIETKKETRRIRKQTSGTITDAIWDDNNLVVQESNVITPNDGSFYYASPTFISYSNELKEISRQTMNDVTFKSSIIKKNGNAIELHYEGKSAKILGK
jgi:hypothetical protein